MRFMMIAALILFIGSLAAVAPGQVLINEFLAKNVAGIKDEKGEYEDWLELVNLGVSAVDISDFYLTDNLTNLSKWQIPKGTILPPGGVLLFWADEDQQDGPYHTNFKLDKEGEEIGFVAKDGTTLIDSVKFGQQAADISQGRLVGHNVWVTFPAPTPRAQNQPVPCGNLLYNAKDNLANPGEVIAVQGPKVGQMATFRVQKIPASTTGVLALSTLPFHTSVSGAGVLLINPGTMLMFPLTSNSQGIADFNIPIPPASVLAGVSFYFQGFFHSGMSGGLTGGLITRICP